MTKFRNVRKWAKSKGFEVVDANYTYIPRLKIIVDDGVKFIVEMRESTIFQSVHGQRGNPKGLYMALDNNPKEQKRYNRPIYLHHNSQKEIIEKMERDLKRLDK